MNIHFHKSFIQVAVVFLCVCLSVSCGKSSPEQQKKDINRDSCIIIGLLPALDCVPFYYARENRICERLGLQVKFVFANSQMDLDEYLEKGYVDVAASDIFRTVLQQNKKKNIRFLACSPRKWEVYTNRKLRINKYDHLGDRMIGMARNSVPDYICDSINTKIKPGKGILLKPQINDVFLRLQMLNEGQLDAAILPVPLTEKAKSRKHIKLNPSISQEGLAGFSINARSMERHAKELGLLLKAYNAAVDSLKNNPANGITATLLSRFGMDSIPSSIIKSPLLCHLSSPKSKDISTAVSWAKRRKIAHEGYTGDTLVYQTTSRNK